MSNKIVGEFGRGMVERNMGVTERKDFKFYTTVSVVGIDHDYSTDEYIKEHRKRLGFIRAYRIPFWGESLELIKNFK